jgi:iron complex outermembrane receptor protein
MNHGRSLSTVVSLIAALSIFATNTAFAIDEIVVKTRKTEENLQDVPLAITTVSAQVLERTGSDSLEAITRFSPSFIFDQNSAQKDLRIGVRGLSASLGRSNVAFLVDGIDVTSEAIGTAGAGLLTSQRLLSDVQQVEAVKGPQSALYGRAAFAGAINYVTKDAPDEFEASIGGEFAEYGDNSVNGSIGAPINDTLGWLASGYWFDNDGQYHNAISGSPLGGGEGAGASLTLNWAPTDTLDFKARFEYIDEEYDDLPRVRYVPDVLDRGTNPRPGDPLFVNDGEDFLATYPGSFGDVSSLESQDRAFIDDLIASDPDYAFLDNTSGTTPLPLRRSENPRSYCVPTGSINPDNGKPTFDCDLSRTPSDYKGTTQELFRFSLVANWDVDAIKGTLSSLTGYIDSETHEEYDWDANAIGRLDTIPGTHDIFNDDTVEIFSQEFRYRSDFEGPLNFTLGAQYWTQERVQFEEGMLSAYALGVDRWQEDFFSVIETGENIRDPRTVEDDHKSLYAMLEWDINDQWSATIENRYSDETFEQDRIINITAFGVLNVRNQDCSFTGSAPGSPAICQTTAWANTPKCFPGGPGNCAFATPNEFRLVKDVKSKFNTPKVTIEFKPNDDSLYYFSVGKAVKPAGLDVLGGGGPPVASDFNAPGGGGEFDITTEAGYLAARDQVVERYIGEIEFDSEKMWAYELGTKNTFTGGFGDLVLNSAVFFQDYTDKQVSVRQLNPVTGTIQSQTINAGKAEVWGLELETSWFTPVDGLTINAAWTWLIKSEYTDFDEVTTSQNTAAKLDNCIPVDRFGDPDGTPLTNCLVSRAGRGLERAPEHAIVLGANFTRPLAGTSLEWFVEGNALYQDTRFADPEEDVRFEEYYLVDLRLGLESDQWEALIFVDNVFDEDTIKSGSGIPDFSQPLNGPAPNFGTVGILPDQRQVGVRMKYRF